MFNDKPYSAVNREERFFCSLFAHALLSSPPFRERIVGLVADRLEMVLDPLNLHVYLEAAALRDYWRDLGDPGQYDAVTHARRRAILDAVLRSVEVDPHLIDAHELFWTAGTGSKLCYPGRWSRQQLQAVGLGKLLAVRWAFNAKPDMLLLSPSGALVLEAKVGSGEGYDDAGYQQMETQQRVVELWRELIPCFSRIPIRLATLKARRDPHGIAWSDVIAELEGIEVDAFTRACFQRLVNRSRSRQT